MTNLKEQRDRFITLQEKAAFGGLNAIEEGEVAALERYLENPATENQVEYIEALLERLGADLSEYTDTDQDLLTYEEASDLIDDLKDDAYLTDAWDN
jgi:uncharacterized protein YqeY